jgi:hypothetical protein
MGKALTGDLRMRVLKASEEAAGGGAVWRWRIERDPLDSAGQDW